MAGRQKIKIYKFSLMTTQDNGDDIKKATKGDARNYRLRCVFTAAPHLMKAPQFIKCNYKRYVSSRPPPCSHIA